MDLGHWCNFRARQPAPVHRPPRCGAGRTSATRLALSLACEDSRSRDYRDRIGAPARSPDEIRIGGDKVIIVPNKNVSGNVIVNATASATRRVKEAFEKKGLSMPYPQQDIHLKSVPKEFAD